MWILKLKIDSMGLRTPCSSLSFLSVMLSKSSPGQANDTLNTLASSLGCLEDNPKHPRSLEIFGSLNPVPFTLNVLHFWESGWRSADWKVHGVAASSCIMSEEHLSHSLQAPVGFLGGTLWVSSAVVVSCHFRAYVSGCRSRTASQKLHSYTRSSTPPTINTPSEPPLITPERPNPLRPLLTNIAFCQLFAVCLSGNYKDPKHRLLHSFG